jgi:hypothetical protein
MNCGDDGLGIERHRKKTAAKGHGEGAPASQPRHQATLSRSDDRLEKEFRSRSAFFSSLLVPLLPFPDPFFERAPPYSQG